MIRCLEIVSVTDKLLPKAAAVTGILVMLSLLASAGLLGSPVLAAPELTDQAISDKVEDELQYDRGVLASKVDVATSGGIVTLTGQVNNILAKERAARIAETVKGVRAVVNRIQVQPSTSRSDAEIEKDVEAALENDPAAKSYHVTAAVADGVVTLSGTVDSYQAAELVKKVAQGVRGVTDLNEQIDVDYKTERPDDAIQADIQEALRWNVRVDDHLIDVTVSNGKVLLSGTVGSAAEKRLAQAEAWVAGVESVDASKLDVEGWARDPKLRGDKYVIQPRENLDQAVKDALLQDPRVMSFNVQVESLGSAVTLRGTVDNLVAKRAAAQDALNTVGVTALDNRIKVRLDDTPTDAAIAQDIDDALRRDPYLERFQISAAVLNGTAYLSGKVDSYFEKLRAEDIVARVAGVVDIKNNLNIDYDSPYIYDPYVDDGYIERDELIDYERRAPYRTDAQIKDAIESQLWWSPFVESDVVTVQVENGVATLTGTVDSWSEYRAATENAYEGGATLVDNDLLVKYE